METIKAMARFLIGANSVGFWTALSTVAVIATLFVIVHYSRETARLTIQAMDDALQNFNKELATTHYTELDRMYFDLLNIPLGKPYLLTPGAISGVEHQHEYDIYAYL